MWFGGEYEQNCVLRTKLLYSVANFKAKDGVSPRSYIYQTKIIWICTNRKHFQKWITKLYNTSNLI
jgi:hypothetical protein